MEAGKVKETFQEIHGLAGLINNGRFEALSEWRNPQYRFFKDDHLDPAAGDYEPIQRDKRRTRIEVKQHVETIVSIRNVFEEADHNQQ
jgi:hypothetical protein